jgi:hypothetical protein
MQKISLTALILFFCPALAFSTPFIISLSGLVADGQEITIYGTNFGPVGPEVVLFDDFSSGVEGQRALDDAVIGRWDQMSGFIFADPLLSNGKGLRVVDSNYSCGWGANWINFGETYSEIFITSKAYVPEGYCFPGATAEKTMPAISGLKHHWPMYGEKGYTVITMPDIFSPNWTGRNFYNVASNDSPLSSYDTSSSAQWVWSEPVKWSLWMKGNGTSIEGSDGVFHAVSSSGQTLKRYQNYKAWFNPDHEVFGWDRMTVVGYLRGASYPRDNYVIDDVYVAVGPNSCARVEIGDSPEYQSCKKMAICTPKDWSDNVISLSLREGNFKEGEIAYLFVVDSNHNISPGYLIQFGKGYAKIKPVENLRIGSLLHKSFFVGISTWPRQG